MHTHDGPPSDRDLARKARQKAVTARAKHAKRFRRTIVELEDHFGWELEVMQAAILRVLHQGCPEKFGCGTKDHVRDLADIHIDIYHPTDPRPHWGVNAGPICWHCNLSKNRLSSVDVAEREALKKARAKEELHLFDVGYLDEPPDEGEGGTAAVVVA